MPLRSQFPSEQGESGEFERQEDAFRDRISSDGSTSYPATAGRYHLYVSLACPWAHRTLIVRKLLGLESAVGMTVVDPVRDEKGWAFRDGPGHSCDPVNGFSYLAEAYRATDPDFGGRVTVPVLWDTEGGRIVNNSEDDICRMFAEAFAGHGSRGADLFPEDRGSEHGELAAMIYENINNGVYRAGFATKQDAYESAVRRLFAALDVLDKRLGKSRFLLGAAPVEADWRLFCTLVRFDAVYFGHFKCNLRRIADYPNLSGYVKDLYQWPGIADDVNFDHIKRHYYMTHDEINPTGIVPLGPDLDLRSPRGREAMPAK
ncbi:MAG: glutathione S-transferase family protein [Opitutales bacterium]|nr:glutathione S-transferase family protein [Opitutales bacterium]